MVHVPRTCAFPAMLQSGMRAFARGAVWPFRWRSKWQCHTVSARAASTSPPLRNVAIIAHVDHGKTTLVDQLLRAGSGGADLEGERVMDSIELERERGITIMSKVTRVQYQGLGINIVDTPGHQDFGGEVERVLSMVDGVVLIVDAAEGPMSQTKFVLRKALAAGAVPIVVVNKVDRSDALGRLEARAPDNEIFDLFINLDADDDQLDFVTLYASGREGWVAEDINVALLACADDSGEESRRLGAEVGMDALLRAIRDRVPPPRVGLGLHGEVGPTADDTRGNGDDCAGGGGNLSDARSAPFAMSAVMLSHDPFVGQLVTGKIQSGTLRVGDRVRVLSCEGTPRGDGRVARIFDASYGTGGAQGAVANCSGSGEGGGEEGPGHSGPRTVSAGDIVTVAPGIDGVCVSDTLCDDQVTQPLPATTLDPPVISMKFSVNDSPLGGRSGKHVTGSAVAARLEKEALNNVALSVSSAPGGVEVHGRGELQLAILVEEMRREGYEFTVSPPRAITRTCDETGETLEPYEEAQLEVDTEHAGTVIDRLSSRGGELKLFEELGASEGVAGGRVRLAFSIPSRGLLGYRSELQVDTHGSGILHSQFEAYQPHRGALPIAPPGKLVADRTGVATAYALSSLEERGALFIEVGDDVYEGMIVGEHNRPNDLPVNATREKKLDNMRTVLADEGIFVSPPRRFSLEDLLSYVSDGESIEVTPEALRLRFVERDAKKRARLMRSTQQRRKTKGK